MLRVSIDHLQPGMKVARNIYSASGLLLVASDVILDAGLITRLERLRIDSVYVHHPYVDVEPQEILQEKTRVEAVVQTRKAFEDFQKTRKIDLRSIHKTTKSIIEDALNNRDTLIHLTDIRTHDDYTFGHSINVCLLSVLIGQKLFLRKEDLFEMAVGAILHDVGKMLVPPEILNKPGKFTPEEWKVMQGHADKGFEILRKQGGLSVVSAHVAYQHHENYDGTGYSRGLAGEEIHRYARIASIADVFDALTADRPYRKACLPHEAYEIMAGSRGAKFDPEIVDVFLDNVALYPLGSTVRLDTEEIGVVIGVQPKLQMRPIIKVIIDQYGKPWQGPEKIVDLTRDLTRFVTGVLKPEEVIALGS